MNESRVIIVIVSSGAFKRLSLMYPSLTLNYPNSPRRYYSNVFQIRTSSRIQGIRGSKRWIFAEGRTVSLKSLSVPFFSCCVRMRSGTPSCPSFVFFFLRNGTYDTLSQHSRPHQRACRACNNCVSMRACERHRVISALTSINIVINPLLCIIGGERSGVTSRRQL